MSDRARRRAEKAGSAKTRRIVFAGVGALVLVVVVCAGWVGVRLALSYSQVSAVRAEAGDVIAELSADPSKGTAVADRLRDLDSRLDDAQALSSDVVWRTAEVIPFLGDNLRSYRMTVEALQLAG